MSGSSGPSPVPLPRGPARHRARVAVLDRTKEPGAVGEPLYLDVVTALVEARRHGALRGRPRWSAAATAWPPRSSPRPWSRRSSTSCAASARVTTSPSGSSTTSPAPAWSWRPDGVSGAESDGRAGRLLRAGHRRHGGGQQELVKIIGEQTGLFAQGYFVYDSKKAGRRPCPPALRPRADRSTYLIDEAGFVACHQFGFLDRSDVLEPAEQGATFLLNSPYGPTRCGSTCPARCRSRSSTRA